MTRRPIGILTKPDFQVVHCSSVETHIYRRGVNHLFTLLRGKFILDTIRVANFIEWAVLQTI